MVVLGIICAIPVFFALTAAGVALLGNVRVPNPEPEFYVSWAATAFFIFVSLLAVAGLIMQARVQMSALGRAFTIAFLCTTLGFFAICDLFSFASHG